MFLPHRELPVPPLESASSDSQRNDDLLSCSKPVTLPVIIPTVKSNETSFIGQQRSLVDELKLRLDGGVYNFLKPHQPEENVKDTRLELRRRRKKKNKMLKKE